MPGVVTAGIYLHHLLERIPVRHDAVGQAVRTVTVALQLFIGEFTIQWGLLTAGGTLIALPWPSSSFLCNEGS